MTIRYTTDAGSITVDQLGGFFEGWPHPPSAQHHLQVLRGSHHVVLAVEPPTDRLVGFITAIADGHLAAYIPLLEVLPPYRGQGIGRELTTRMLAALDGYYMVDLVCDEALRGFYHRLGLQPLLAMGRRNRQALQEQARPEPTADN